MTSRKLSIVERLNTNTVKGRRVRESILYAGRWAKEENYTKIAIVMMDDGGNLREEYSGGSRSELVTMLETAKYNLIIGDNK